MDEVTLTAQGQEAANMEYSEFVSDVVAQHPLIVMLAKMTESDRVEYIAKHSKKIGSATQERRHQCLKKWFRSADWMCQTNQCI